MQVCKDFVKADMLPVIYLLQGGVISARLIGSNLARKLWAEYKKLPVPSPQHHSELGVIEPDPGLVYNSVQAARKSIQLNSTQLHYKSQSVISGLHSDSQDCEKPDLDETIHSLSKQSEDGDVADYIKAQLFRAFLIFCDMDLFTMTKACFVTLLKKTRVKLDMIGFDIHMSTIRQNSFTFDELLDLYAMLHPSAQKLLHFVQNHVEPMVQSREPPFEACEYEISLEMKSV